MSVLLGIDTGGTFTDAVLFDDVEQRVIASAKSRTTHEQLAIGIGGAARSVIEESGVDAASIALASVSTTLATNALVESKGGRVALVFIGFSDGDLDRGGLADALGSDPLIRSAGGHNSHGDARAEVDLDAIEAEVRSVVDSVDAFAVVAEFSVRNPAHELAAAGLIRRVCDRPVTCSHELTAKLNGPKRAVTTVLNARLIGLLDELMRAADDVFAELGVNAPVMVVRGDGSLVSADFARQRPIETILSGPAASVVGASHLAEAKTALVSDIGGTTTDVAVVHDGRPTLDAQGATVGGHRTMVEAVAMHTHGLGGDSEVQADLRSLPGRLVLGPRRALPLAVLAADVGDSICAELDRQFDLDITPESAGRFVVPSPRVTRHGELSNDEVAMLDAVRAEVQSIDRLARNRAEQRALASLIRQNLVMISAFTPTDAAHVLGLQATWNTDASIKAAALLAKLRGADGNRMAESAEELSQRTIDSLIRRSAEVVLDAGLGHDGVGEAGRATSELAQRSIDRRNSPPDGPVATTLTIGLAVPVVGLGASAATYYPKVGDLLGVAAEIPDHADVANAVGAVVGQVRLARDVVISQPSDGAFRSHVLDEPHNFLDLEAARSFTEDELRKMLEEQIAEAGASEPKIEVTWDPTFVTVDNAQLFVEGRMTATAIARPKF